MAPGLAVRQDLGTKRYYTRVMIRVGKKKVYVRSPNRLSREEAEADGRRLGAAQTLEEAYATQAALAGERAKTSTGVIEKDGTFWGYVWKREKEKQKKKTSIQVRGPPRGTEAEALEDRAALLVATGVVAAREIAARLTAVATVAAAAAAGAVEIVSRSNLEPKRSGFRASVHRLVPGSAGKKMIRVRLPTRRDPAAAAADAVRLRSTSTLRAAQRTARTARDQTQRKRARDTGTKR